MIEKYVLIVFEGDYTRVESHIKEKINSIQNDDLFLIGTNKIYIKLTADDHDDLFFFRNYEIDDVTKTKYISMEDIEKEDFLIKREEYKIFKTVNDLRKNISNVTTIISDKIEPMINNLNTLTKAKEERAKPSNSDGNSDMNNIVNAINDTSLPSKQPLQDNDPFAYLSSRNFMLSFLLISLVLIGIMNIMN